MLSLELQREARRRRYGSKSEKAAAGAKTRASIGRWKPAAVLSSPKASEYSRYLGTLGQLEFSVPAARILEMIEVKHSAEDEWMISVKGAITTHHRVRLTEKDCKRLAEGRSPEELLQESFRFLLERESNTSILSSFDLPVIGSYFPEYERDIRARLRQLR